MTRLTVGVLTHNEQKHIRDCLASVRAFADELLVLDDFSTDDTVALAREMGARVEFRKLDNFPNQRNAAIELARSDWIFFIDADERATPALGQEIADVFLFVVGENTNRQTCHRGLAHSQKLARKFTDDLGGLKRFARILDCRNATWITRHSGKI